MDELRKLLEVIERKGRAHGSQLINFSDEESLEARLYTFIKQNELLDEDVALRHLYASNEKKDAFKMLKSRFRKKLYNQLHFLNNDSFPKLAAGELSCDRLLTEANVLFKSMEVGIAQKRVLLAIKLARELNLTDELVRGLELYQQLLVDGYYNRQKFQKCKEELEEQYKVQVLEREAVMLFNEVYINLSAGVEPRHEVAANISDILDEIESLWQRSKSPKIFKKYYKVKLTYFEMTGRFSEQIRFIKETNVQFENGEINPIYFSISFNRFILAYACLRAKEYEEGLKAVGEALPLIAENTHNWFATIENKFLLYVHSRKYKEAESVIQDVLSNNNLHNVDQAFRERWVLFANLFNVLFDLKLDTKSFHIAIINKDKKGFNIWLLIVDFFRSLRKSDDEELQREAERIRKYMSKHLDAKADPRTKLFLKLLMLVVREDLNLTRIKEKSRYLYTKLSQTPPAGDAYAEIEIVPFEHLWEFILNILARQKIKVSDS